MPGPHSRVAGRPIFPAAALWSHHECTITSTSKSPLPDLEGKIIELKKLAENGEAVDVGEEIARLEKRSRDALRDVYKALTPWQKAQVARHPDRPHCLDYVGGLFTEFTPLAGDRAFGEDHAIVCGFGRFRGEPIAVIGQEKGDDTKSRLKHNFGMAKPEGYRKAVRFMELADRFGVPVHQPCRHRRRLSRHQRRGARPGRSDRPLDLGVPGAEGAVAVGHHRRRRLRRRHRDRHGKPRLHAGARHLFGDLAGGRGVDPVARFDARQGCGDQHEDHRAGSARPQDHRRHHRRAARRRPSRRRGGDRGDRRPDRQGRCPSSPGRTWISASSGARNTWRSAAVCKPARPAAPNAAHFRHKNAVAWQSTICREGSCRALAVINFQG